MTVLLIHRRFLTFVVAYTTVFFCCQCLGGIYVSIQTLSLHIPNVFGKIWNTWVSFIVVIVIAIVVDSFLHISKSIFWSSMKCCWYVWVMLLIETCIFWTNYGTVSLTLDVIFLYWDFGLSLKCACSGPNPDRFGLLVNICANIVNKSTEKMKPDL